jgi:hypothetical protein
MSFNNCLELFEKRIYFATYQFFYVSYKIIKIYYVWYLSDEYYKNKSFEKRHPSLHVRHLSSGRIK